MAADMSTFQKYGMIFILVIVGFSLIAALYPKATTATDSVNASNMCASAGCYWNSTGSTGYECQDNSTDDAVDVLCTGAAQGAAFPLSRLAAGGGILFIVLAASILMYYLKRGR